MKKKNLLLLSLAALSYVAVHAQHGRFQGGINLANVSVSDDGSVDDAKSLTSFQIGVIGDFQLGGPLYIQPGLVFSGKGTEARAGDQNSATYYKTTSNPYYIEVPVNLVFKTPGASGPRLFVGAGPYLGIGVAGKNKVEGKYLGVGFSSQEDIDFSGDDPTTLDYEEGAGFGIMKRFDYGLNGTVGIEGKSMTLSANYGLGLAKLQSGSDSGADNNNKHRVLSFTLGFKF